MKTWALPVVLGASLIWPLVTEANELLFQGEWNTTNRKLSGTMTCVVTDVGDEHGRGRFEGIWQGTPFSYTVEFFGPDSNLRGTATIDGARYEWNGSIERTSNGRFRGTFRSNRYVGYFDLRGKGAGR